MKSISIFAFVCINYFGFTQSIKPISQTAIKINQVPTVQLGTESTVRIHEGKTIGATVEDEIPFYSSTDIYVQRGNELVSITLSQTDFHFFKRLIDELLVIDHQLSDVELNSLESQRLQQERLDKQQAYDNKLNQVIINGQ